MNLKFDTEADGLSKVLRGYQVKALRTIWEDGGEGLTSREVWESVNQRLEEGDSISRASIINFLNAMVEEELLGYREESGKGGYHRIYTPKMDESGFKKHIAKTMIASLMEDFPEETKQVIQEQMQ